MRPVLVPSAARPGDTTSSPPGGPAHVFPFGDWARAVRTFYRDPLSWVGLLITSVMLCYVGGGAMFWFHSEYLGEGGPAIPWHVHWLLDSTFGFIALTPILALILPFMSRAAVSLTGSLRPVSVPVAFAVLVGATFAVVTTPGPLAHDLLVGRGTWIAGQVTQWLGDPSAQPLPPHHDALLAKLTQQLGFGLPLYVLLAYASVVVLRSVTTARWSVPERPTRP